MKRLIAIALLAASLGGCQAAKVISAASGFSVTQQQLDSAENFYDGTALVTLSTYANWPRCASGTKISVTNRCHDPAILKKLRNADNAVETAFIRVQNQITSGNSSGAVAAWDALQTALGAMNTIIAQNSLGGI
jgi:hypothetical protein